MEPNPPPSRSSVARRRPSRAGSLYLVSVAGIPIYLHFTFLIVLAVIALPGGMLGLSGLSGVLVFILVFVSVALHELGHALAARRFGIQTEDIVLYPIGGVARLRSMGEGLQEFWIAVAGPAVNVVIAAALWAYLRATGQMVTMDQMAVGRAPLAAILMGFNVMLFIFNLIPAFPMDGGRVLRSLLSMATSKQTATAIASKIGQALAILFIVFGLFANLWLTLIGVFVFFAAGQEYSMSRSQAIVSGRRVHESMITRFEVLRHGETLGRAADLLLTTNQQDFPVMHGEEVIGLLSRRKLIEGLAAKGRDEYLAAYMEREFPRLGPWDDLGEAFQQILAGGGKPVLVFDGPRLVGYITHENLMEFMMLERTGK